KEINELRTALNVSKAALQKDKAILGTREYFTKKSGISDGVGKVVENQRHEIDALRRLDIGTPYGSAKQCLDF
ncbi:hypothetical protein DYB28_015516, partial [Aphanomyces astaci]